MEDWKFLFKGLAMFLVALIVITLVVTALNGALYPWILSIQRKSVEQSKSFTDSNNLQLQKYIKEYSDSDSTEEHQKAIINLMCQEISTMKVETVNPNTLNWINSHGGCN